MSKVRCKRSRSARERHEERTTAQRDRDRDGDVENVRAFTSEVLPADQRERFPDAFTQRTDRTTVLQPRATRTMPENPTQQQRGKRQRSNVLRLPSRSSSTAAKTETVSDFKIVQGTGSPGPCTRGASPWAHSAWHDQLDGRGRSPGSRKGVSRRASRRGICGASADGFRSD